MQKAIVTILLFISFSEISISQTDNDLISKVVNEFIEGTTYRRADKIRDAFYPGTKMFLYNDQDTLWAVTSEQYASWYTKNPGVKNDRKGRIVSMDIVIDVAYVKIEVDIPSFGNRYYDLLLLKKIKGDWKIISKCTSAEPIPKRPQDAVALPEKEVVLDQLNHPWSMAFISEYEVVIAEKDGGLVRVNLQSKESKKINGLPKDVARKILIDTSKHAWGVFPPREHGQVKSFNAGWFQVLLDPDYEKNHYIYISYAAQNEEHASTTKVIRGKLEANTFSDVETLFLAKPYSHGLFHYGGGMIFGADGKLYITVGERNLFEHHNPVPPLSQDISDRRGKVYRINPDGSIPDDNPDFGPNAVKGLYATGIRASQGLALETSTGEIWFSDHGTIQGDELNILEGGANYGWPHRTSGKYRSKDYNPPLQPGLVFTGPIHYWDQTVAPTGLTFYKGREFPQWNGNLIVPGLSKGSLWRMIIEDQKVIGAEELFINDRVRLRKAIVSPRGKLYLLTDEDDGKLIRVRNRNM